MTCMSSAMSSTCHLPSEYRYWHVSQHALGGKTMIYPFWSTITQCHSHPLIFCLKQLLDLVVFRKVQMMHKLTVQRTCAVLLDKQPLLFSLLNVLSFKWTNECSPYWEARGEKHIMDFETEILPNYIKITSLVGWSCLKKKRWHYTQTDIF